MARKLTRRKLLSIAGALGGAGCLQPQSPSGPRTPPQSPEGGPTQRGGLVIADFRGQEGDNGNLEVLIVIENRGENDQSATIEVVAQVGDQSFQRTETVGVPAGERVETVLEFDVAYDDYVGDGSISATIV